MRAHVEFRSDKFPPYPGDVEGINAPHVYGKRVAEYLQAELPKHGWAVRTIGDEDWGWYVELENEGFRLWLGCGPLGEDPQEPLTAPEIDSDKFLVFIEPSKPVIRRWFRKIDVRNTVSRLGDTLDQILRSDPGITDVRWWEEEGQS